MQNNYCSSNSRWLLTIMFALLFSIGNAWGASPYNFSSIPTTEWTTSGGSKTINGVSWTYSTCTYIGATSASIQIGSKKNPQTSAWTIQAPISSFGTGITVTAVSITAYTTASSATYDISVNGSSVKSGSLTTSSTTYTASSLSATSGSIVITMTGSSTSKALYLSNISVTYTTGGGSTCANPTFSPGAGSFCGSTSVTLSCATDGATIRYTTNGDDPTESSSAYSTAIPITSTTTIKAKAFKSGYTASSVASATYTNSALTTMDAIYSAATGSEVSTCITFNNWVISGVSLDGKNVYLTDGTKGLIIYNSGGNSGFAVGNILSGTATCSLKKYNQSAELVGLKSNASGLSVTTGGSVSPITVDESDISELTGVNTGCVITTTGVCGTCNTDKQCINGAQLFNQLYSYSAPTNGTTYTVTGVYVRYNSTQEILPLSDLTTYTITATRNNNDYGTVSVSGTTITATPASGYKVMSGTDGYTVVSGTATVTNNGDNTFTVSPSSDCTIRINFAAKETATVKIEVAGSESTISGTRYEGDSYTLPSTAADCPDVGLYGWYKGTYSHATTAPSGANFYLPGASATLTAGENKFYAVYATIGAPANTYTKITTTGELTTGDYLIAGISSWCMSNTVNASNYMNETAMSSYYNSSTGVITNTSNSNLVWTITKSGDNYTLYNAAADKYLALTTTSPVLSDVAHNFTVSLNGSCWCFASTTTTGYMLVYSTYFKSLTAKSSDVLLYKRDQTISGPYTTSPSCVTHDLTVVASPVAGGTATAVKTVLGEGKTTTAEATPNDHYTFSHWTISGTGSSMSNTSDGKSTDNPVTVTMGTDDATLTAHFTEKEKCTVIFQNNGVTKSTTTYWLGENPVAPTLTDGTEHDACDATSDKHYGWTRNKITGNVADQATLDARTGSNVVYTKDATLPAITAGDDGTTITYHAVWAAGDKYWGRLTSSTLSGLATGDRIVIVSTVSGRSGALQSITKTNDNEGVAIADVPTESNNRISNPSNDIIWTLNANSTNWEIKSGDDKLGSKYTNCPNSNGTGILVQKGSNWTTWTFGSSSSGTDMIYIKNQGTADCQLGLGIVTQSSVNTWRAIKQATVSSASDCALKVYKEFGSYSTFLTSCCDNKVALSDGTLVHCTIAFSNDNPQTCSATDAERQVTITVTPDAGYEMTSEARLTFTKSSGTATAAYVSGPTTVGATYQFVYQFTKDDNGEGTFDASCSPKTYTITLDQSTATTAGTSSVEVTYDAEIPAIAALPERTDYNFRGYYTGNCSGTQLVNINGTWKPNVSNYISSSTWVRDGNVTLYPCWQEKPLKNYRTACTRFDIFNQDKSDEADVHLTSTKDVTVYATSASGNLIRIVAKNIDAIGSLGGGTANKQNIQIRYLDADDNEVATASCPFRLCNNGSSNYNNADGSNLNLNGLTNYDQTFSISYTPSAYNQVDHYKLQLRLQNNNTEYETIVLDLYGRSLPKEFAIVGKYADDGKWYALPTDLATSSDAATAITPTEVTVDNTTTPTKITSAPDNIIFTACDRYKNSPTNTQFASIRFTPNGTNHLQAAPIEYPMWMPSGNAVNQNFFLKSSDLQSYDVQWDPAQGSTKLIGFYASSGVKMGFHTTGPKGHAIYFLPTEYEEIGSTVMEWGTSHIVLSLSSLGTATKVKTQIAGGALSDAHNLTSGSVNKDAGIYRIPVTLTAADAAKDLKVYFYNSGDALIGSDKFTIPLMVSASDATTSAFSISKKDAVTTDLIVLNGGVLTVSETTVGTKYTFKDLYVYGGGKLVVPTGTYIDFSNVYLRGGHLNNSWEYQYSNPQLVLNGTMGNTSNTLNYDYLTNNAQFYSLALPYQVQLGNIVNPYFNNKQSWVMHAYDGAARKTGEKGWYDVEEGSTAGSISALTSSSYLTVGMGYTFWGAMQKVGGVRQKWSVNRFPMTLETGSAEAEKSGVTVTAHGMTDATTIADGLKPNDVGWNMLGNPYLADLGGTSAFEGSDMIQGKILSFHSVKTLDASGNWTGGWHEEANEEYVRYVRIPNDQGTEYEEVRFKDAILKAFRHFFIQASTSGTFSFGISMRAQAAPAYLRATNELPEEMDVDFTFKSDCEKATFGLTISKEFAADFVIGEDMPQDMSGTGLKAHTIVGETPMAFNGLTPAAAEGIIPVGYRTTDENDLTFAYKADDDAGYIEHIWLTDHQTGSLTDLKQQPYTFHSEGGEFSERFTLSLEFKVKDTPTNLDEAERSEIDGTTKFIYEDKLYLRRDRLIYDSTGKRVNVINK